MGLEPTVVRYLKPMRLPVPPSPHMVGDIGLEPISDFSAVLEAAVSANSTNPPNGKSRPKAALMYGLDSLDDLQVDGVVSLDNLH